MVDINLIITTIGSLATVIGVGYQLKNGVSFRRKNSLRSMLMFHKAVFEKFKAINREIDDELSGIHFGKFLIILGGISFIIAVISIVLCGNSISNERAIIVGILLSSIITPIVSPRLVKGRILATIFNITIPVLILLLILFVPLITPVHYNQSNSFAYFKQNRTLNFSNRNSHMVISVFKCVMNRLVLAKSNCKLNICMSKSSSKSSPTSMIIHPIFAFVLELLWLLGVSRASLRTEGRELDILSKEDSIKSSAFGLLVTLAISGMLLILWIQILSKIYWFDAIIAIVYVITLGYLISDIKETAIRLLWKVRVPRFAEDLPPLPMLIVKTKSDNIFFGQLYDPLDNKLLVLKDAKLLHNNQQIETLVNSNENEKNNSTDKGYWSIPWDDIESMKIVAEDLYDPVLDKTTTKQTMAKQIKPPDSIWVGWKCALSILKANIMKSINILKSHWRLVVLLIITWLLTYKMRGLKLAFVVVIVVLFVMITIYWLISWLNVKFYNKYCPKDK